MRREFFSLERSELLLAYADPQTLTIGGVAKTLPRVPSEAVDRIGKFSGDDGLTVLTVHQNQSTGRFRREIRLTTTKVVADPISAVNKSVSASLIIGVDEPKYGFSDGDLKALWTALRDTIDASSGLKMTQLLNGEL